MLIYFTLDKKDIRAASRETMNFLKTTGKFRYSKKDFLPKDQTVVPDYLESTLNWMRFSFELYQERGMPMAVTYVRLMLSADTAKDQNYRKRLEEIKSSELRKVALKYLAGKKYVMIRIIPKNKK